jgi:hypothetical protein
MAQVLQQVLEKATKQTSPLANLPTLTEVRMVSGFIEKRFIINKATA